jgi:nickel-dependent lactate racemase
MTSSQLRYGQNGSLAIDLPPGVLVADCFGPEQVSPMDISEAVSAAVTHPLNFPPLSQATVPGDEVVLALEPGLPRSSELVAALVEHLCETGTSPERITVLRTHADVVAGAGDPRHLLPANMAAVKLETHEPDQRGQLRYLAATEKGRPIYLSRALCDADLVVPIGCLRCDEAINYHGVYSGLYPVFSDTKTQQRYRHPQAVAAHTSIHAQAQHEVETVGWLAGTQFVIQVLPGPDDSLLGIFAGDADTVMQQGRQRSNEVWCHSVPRRASLVVGAIPGGVTQQTWDNLGRAVAAASRVVIEGGAIALCTELAASPGPAVQLLSGSEDLSSALRRIDKERAADSLPARALAEALEFSKVYLYSQLDSEMVEELGIASIADPVEISRLARRHSSCLLLHDAQYRTATPIED